MNRVIRAAAAAAVAAGGAGSVGCVHDDAGPKTHGDGMRYRTWVDTSYPERYNATARAETVAPFAAQVNNGHVLNQTIWNWYFEAGTDKLNTAGMAKLDSIAQTRPGPDGRLYLQAARDLRVTPENQDKLGDLRNDLTVKRAAAVQKYMASQPAVQPAAYEVYVHDLPTSGVPADFAASAFRGQLTGYRGGLTAGGGTAALSTGNGGLQQPGQPQSSTNTNINTGGGVGGGGPGSCTGGAGSATGGSGSGTGGP
ncbi:MAG: hypothetical protein K2P78_01485 [Gemmataceae bacterium]|nr:hypothetical protein [Gemmataceae bacterium]